MKHLPLLALLLIFSGTHATTYYVSTSGSNTNDGLTPASAFQTLQHASDVVAAGDSVIALPGTYSGFYHTTSGTSTNPIVFSAQEGALINAPNSTTNDGINLEGASYIIVEGFSVYGVPRAGLRAVLNEGVVFRSNKADSCGMWGILTGFSENILIEHNECSRSVVEHGIYFSNSADNPVIRNNICWGNNANGIHMNGDVSLGGGDGIISNALVENNIIYENGNAGGSGINCDGVQNSRIQNNLLYNNHASGISLYRIDGGGGSSNNVVVNNTIVQPVVTRWALNISDGSTGNIAFNNIFYSDHSFRGSISVDAASMPGFKSDYNVVTERMSDDGGSSNMTLAEWQQATLQDSHSVVATPAQLFVDAAIANYHLSGSSPAKDLGVSTFNLAAIPATDLDNQPRTQGAATDAGAYEFQVASFIRELPRKELNWTELSPQDKVQVFDLSGKLLLKGSRQQADETAKSWQHGIYLFRVESSGYGGWLVLPGQ